MVNVVTALYMPEEMFREIDEAIANDTTGTFKSRSNFIRRAITYYLKEVKT